MLWRSRVEAGVKRGGGSWPPQAPGDKGDPDNHIERHPPPPALSGPQISGLNVNDYFSYFFSRTSSLPLFLCKTQIDFLSVVFYNTDYNTSLIRE